VTADFPSSRPIRVGLIGANADRGWSAITHLPALAALDEFTLTAVCTTREESALRSAALNGGCRAYTDAASLARDPDVELVVVSVKTMHHEEAVRAALEAGKHCLCEWPLTPSLAAGVALRDLADSKGVRGFVGLQGYASAAMRHAASLIEQGFLGELLSATLHASTSHFGAATAAGNAYSLDRSNGANLLTIIAGHALDMMTRLTGELEDASVIIANRRTRSRIVETGAEIAMTAPDQLAIAGRLESGAIASVHIHGGTVEPHRFSLELHGTVGTLRLSSNAVAEIMPLRLEATNVASEPLAMLDSDSFAQDIPASLRAGPAANVAALYRDVYRDLRDGGRRAPDFAAALLRKRALEALETAAATGPVKLE
jgi:predicted dehydrogenase